MGRISMYPDLTPESHRQTLATVLVSKDAAVAEVSYTAVIDGDDPFESPFKVFSGRGASKRDREDKHDPVTGELLAVARAYEQLAARLHKVARKRMNAQEAKRRQKVQHREPQDDYEEEAHVDVRELVRDQLQELVTLLS